MLVDESVLRIPVRLTSLSASRLERAVFSESLDVEFGEPTAVVRIYGAEAAVKKNQKRRRNPEGSAREGRGIACPSDFSPGRGKVRSPCIRIRNGTL